MKNVTSSSSGGTKLPDYSQGRSPVPIEKAVQIVGLNCLDSFRPALDDLLVPIELNRLSIIVLIT
jgi:hypothetical protein